MCLAGWPDDSLLIFCSLFSSELSEEEADDVLFKEVGCLSCVDSEICPMFLALVIVICNTTCPSKDV